MKSGEKPTSKKVDSLFPDAILGLNPGSNSEAGGHNLETEGTGGTTPLKCHTTLQHLVIEFEALLRQELITDYNRLQLVVCYRSSKNGRIVCFDIARYNPRPRDHAVIIGCRVFHDLPVCPRTRTQTTQTAKIVGLSSSSSSESTFRL